MDNNNKEMKKEEGSAGKENEMAPVELYENKYVNREWPKKKKIAVIAIITVFVLGIISFALLVYKGIIVFPQKDEGTSISILVEEGKEEKIKEEDKKAKEEEEQKIQEEQKKAVAPENTEVNILVLNGGASAGSASQVQETLVAQGYENTQADNAQGSYSGLIIYYGDNYKEVANEIKSVLSETYTTVEMKAGMPEGGISGDVVIILGS